MHLFYEIFSLEVFLLDCHKLSIEGLEIIGLTIKFSQIIYLANYCLDLVLSSICDL